MPYAPGIQDISGQLLARGIESSAQARAQGMGAIGNTLGNLFSNYAQKRAQDEEFTAKSKSLENFIKTHADDFAPVDPQTGQKNTDVVLQFLSQSPDENAKQKYLRLGSFLDTAVTGTKMQQAQAVIEAEKLKSAKAKQELDIAKKFAASFLPKPDEGISQPDLSGDVSPERAMQSPKGRQIAYDLYQETGKIPTASAITARMREMAMQQRRQDVDAQLFPTQEAALLDAKAKKEKGLVPAGQELQVKYDRNAGGWYTESGAGIEPTEISAAREEAKKRAELKATSDAEYLKEIRKEGAGAADSRFQNQEIRKLLQSGVRTGPVEGIKSQAKKVAASLGIVDEAEIEAANSYDKLDSLLMRGQIETAQAATRGNLNTFEQQLVQRAVANAQAKLPGANAYLNDVNEAIAAKKEDRYREERRLSDDPKINENQIPNLVRRWELSPENSIPKYLQKIRASEPAPAPTTSAPLPSAGAPTTTTSIAPKSSMTADELYRKLMGN